MIIKNIFNRYLALAMTFLFTSAAWAEKVISVDITTSSIINSDQTTLVGTIPAEAWAKGNAVTQNNLATAEYDTVAATSSELPETKVSWVLSSVPSGLCTVNTAVDSACNYFKSGLCRGNRDSTNFTFTMSNIPYKAYKVYLYFTYDNRDNKQTPFPGVTVNDNDYTVVNGIMKAGNNAAWGSRLTAFNAPELGVNAMCIEGNISPILTITGSTTCGAVAAVQVVEDKHFIDINPKVFDQTLTSEYHETTWKVDSVDQLFDASYAGMMGGGYVNEGTPMEATAFFLTKQADGTVTFEMQVKNNELKAVLVRMKVEDGTVWVKGDMAAYRASSETLGTRCFTEDGTARTSGTNNGTFAQSSTAGGYAVVSITMTPYAVFSNMNSTRAIKTGDNVANGHFSFMIPASSSLPAGSVLRIKSITFASVNGSWVTNWAAGTSDAYKIKLNNVVSDFANGATAANGCALNDTVASNSETTDKVLKYTFSNGCDIIVGDEYAAGSGNTVGTGIGLLYSNDAYYFSQNRHSATVRYVEEGDNDVITAPSVEGYVPVYRVVAEVISIPGGDENDDPVSFETENGPTKAPVVENVATGTGFGADIDYRRTINARKAQVVNVKSAATSDAMIFGGRANGNEGAVNADIWMNIASGTYGSIFGGTNCERWQGAGKSTINGNVVVEVGGETSVDNVIGGFYKGGYSPELNGNIDVVIKDNAVVKGLISGAGHGAHSATATYTGDVKVTVKNVQSDNSAGALVNADSSDYIVGGGVYATNGSTKENVVGNTAVLIDLPTGASGNFVKNIVGGGFIPVGGASRSNGHECKVSGNSSVTINASDSVNFTGTIVAGGYKENDGTGNATVSGTATLTITGGNFDGATLKGGIATGTKTLNVSGTTSKLNVSGFDNVSVTGAATLMLDATLSGNLTIDKATKFAFPDGHAENTPFKLCEGTLNRENSTGTINLENLLVYIGAAQKLVDMVINITDKTITYTLVSVLSTYEFTDSDLAQVSAADVDNGGVCHLAWDNPKNFAADCVFTGIDTDKYLVWVENDINLYVAKKTNSISIKFSPASATEGTIAASDGSVGGFPVAGLFWNHSKQYTNTGAGTTEILKVKDGNGEVLADTRVFYYMPNMYDVNKRGTEVRNYQTTGNGKLTYSYFDDANRAESPAAGYEVTGTIDEVSETYTLPQTPDGRLRWEVGIKSVPYEVFDLYIYHASDQSSAVINLLPIAVKANDGEWKYFAGDGNGSTIAATVSDRWQGAPYCDSPTMVEGTNYIRYRMSAAALGLAEGEGIDTIYLAHPAPTNGRLGLAGIQLVEVEDDGIYSRAADPEDMGGDDDNRNLWSRENSWLNSAGEAMNYPTSGERSLTIDADNVKAIKTDGVIEATKITLINTPAAEGEEPKSFKFLTMEPLSTVNDLSIDPEFIIKSPVDATKFNGQLYLQSRIEGVITLGANARITFVSDVEGEETTAYPYTFKGDASIKLSGPGSFLVPSSMYTAPFTVNEGTLRYAAEGNVTGVISGAGDVVIDPGEGKTVTLSGNNANFTGTITVKSGILKVGNANALGERNTDRDIIIKSGAALDMGGTGNGGEGESYTIQLEENAKYFSSIAAGSDSKWSFFGSKIKLLGDAEIYAEDNRVGLSRGYNHRTTIDLNGYTLTKTGNGEAFFSNLSVEGEGSFDITEGTVRIERGYSDGQPVISANSTIKIGEDATLLMGNYNGGTSLTVNGNIILNGTVTSEGGTSGLTANGTLSGTGTSTIPITLASGATLSVDETVTINNMTINGAAITGTGTIVIPESATLSITTATDSAASLKLAKAGTLQADAAVKFASFIVGEDYSAAEIDGITNLSFDTLTLSDEATLDMTEKIRYPYYTLGATQNGKIKITKPTSRKRIAQVVAGNASGITLVDENGEELDSCVYGGYLYYGTLCTDTEVSADEIAANVVYPSNTTVNGVDVDHYSVNDGKGGIAVATKTDSININFGAVDETSGSVDLADTEVGAYPVSGASWNNSLSNLKDGKGETTTMSVVIEETSTGFPPYGATANTVAANMQLNGNQKLTYGYLDNAESKVWAVTLSNIPYEKFDLYLIAANNGEVGDDGKIEALPYQLTVDGDLRYYDRSGVAGTVDSTWNMKPYAESALVVGENFIKIKFNHKPTTLSIGHPSGTEGVCSLAAIQIVEDKSEGDGIYVRRSDVDLEATGIEKTWSAANSWLDSTGTPTTWNSAGSHFVTIDASIVSEIKVDGKIAADSVTVTGTAGENGFQFLTEEPLNEVADVKEDAPYRLDAPVSLIDFRGDVYLQSRITGQIQLGQYAHIVFVAMVEGEETTAYQYDFNGTIQPIRKIGSGTFVVPSSMYANIPFNITAGNICYDYEGESPVTIGGAWSGSGNVIKRGIGTIKLGVANNEFGGSLFVNEGAVDFGGKWLNSGKGYTVVTQAGTQLTNTGDANSNAAVIKSLTLEGDTTINGNSLGIGCGNDDVATAINLGANTLTLATTGHSYLRKTTISGTGKLVVNDGVRLIVYHNPVSAAEATLEIAAGSSSIELQGDNSAFTVKNLSLNGTLTMPESSSRPITVTGMISGSGSIQNLTLQDGATVELGEESVITVTGTLAFGNTLKIKGGAFDKAAFAFTTEPTALPSNVILVNDEGVGTSGYYFNHVNGKLVIASNEAREINGVVNVSDLLPLSTTRMKLTGDTVFVIDTAEGMPSAINFIADEAHNLAFVYAAPYTGTLTFGDNITVEKKYAKDAWSLVPTTIGPGSIITIIGGDTEEEDFTTAITVQEGGVLHLERLIKLSAANNVNQGGTLDIVEDTTPGAPATFAKVHLADRGMKGTLNIGKNTTYYPFGYPDQPDYDHSTTVINVYGTLDMSDNSNARWTLRSGITINFYVGSQAVGDGQENASHHSAFQFNRADCVLNFLKDGETGGEIDFNLRLRPEHVFTMNIEEGVTVNMGGKLDTGHTDNQPFLLAGDGSVVIKGEYSFGAPLEVPEGKVTIAEGGSLSVKSWIDYEFNENRTSIGTDTNSLSRDNNGNGFSEADELKILSADNKALYTATSPYRSVDYPGNWTAAIYGTLPRLANGVYVGFGNTSAGLALVNGEENVVKVAKMSGNTQFTTIIDVLVPEAHTKDHLYALVRTADSVELYVDGMLRGKYNETVTMNGGMQIGGIYQGVLNSGLVKFTKDAFGGNVNNPTLRASHIDILSVYKSALGPHANETLAKEMSYTLPGGSYKRALTENETYSWEQEGAWKKGEESASKPAELSEVEISVPAENVSAAIKLAETTNIGSLKISGKGMLGIVAENEGVLVNYGDTTIDGVYVTVKHNAVDLSHGALKVSNEGGINFDFSDYNVSHITERKVIPLTGVTEKFEDETISIRKPGQMPSRSMTLEYNETTMRYEVVISIDREIGEVVWNDEDDIAYGKSVLANGAASVLFPGDTLLINSEVSAANSISALNIRIANGGLLKLTGGQNPGTVQVDEGGAYDVNGGEVIPTTLKLNGGKLTNSAATEVKPLATTLDMMADSIVDGNVAFGALTLNGTGTITINDGASIKLGGAVTKSANSELNVANNGIITLTTGTVPAFNALSGAGYIEFAQLTAPGQVHLASFNQFNMPIHLKGISGSAYISSSSLAINSELAIDGSVALNQGGSGMAINLNKVSGSGAFTLSTWDQCTGLSYTISELNNFTGSINIVNNSSRNCTYNFAIGNIVTEKIVYSTPLVKLTRTISREANSIPFDISTVQLNGETTSLLMIEDDGIYHASATYNGTNYRDVNAAIDDAGADHIGEITVYDANAILTGDYIIKKVDGVLSIVPVDKTEITTNTRVSEWTGYTNERLVVDGSANEVTVTFDAKIPEAIKEVRLVGNVKLVAEGAQVIETSKLKGMEGAIITIASDVDDDYTTSAAIVLDNVTISHKIVGAQGAVSIKGMVEINTGLEIAAGATLTINAESAATLKLLKSKIGEGAISLTENVTLYIPEGIQVFNVKGAGKVDGAGLISNEGALSSVYPVSTWSGTYWLKNISANPGNVAFPFESYANANSKLMLTGLSVWLQTDHDVEPVLILKDEGSTPAFTQSDSSQNRWYGLKLAGDGTYILNTRANSALRVLVKDCSEFAGNINAVNRPIYFGTTGANTSTGIIVVNQDASVNVAKGKTWTATNGITINGTIKGSGTLASATTFGATSIIDVSEGNLTLGAGVTLPETINIKGAKSGSVILAGVPAGTQVPKFNLVDNSGILELKLDSNGQLILVGQSTSIEIPELENTSVSVTSNGKPVEINNGSITVDSGTMITVTYTPIPGYVGGGSLTTTVVNGLTPIRSDLISVKKGVKVIIREYKGAKVRTIAGLDEDGIATEGVTINGNDYHPISEAVDGVLLIEIH